MDSDTFSSRVADFVHAVGTLIRRIRTTTSDHELSWTQTAVMSRLANFGPATVSDLARAEGMKPQSMGATIAALDERGIVERRPHETDGRQVRIALSDKGLALRAEMRSAKYAWLTRAVAELTDEERQVLFDATAVIQRLGQK